MGAEWAAMEPSLEQLCRSMVESSSSLMSSFVDAQKAMAGTDSKINVQRDQKTKKSVDLTVPGADILIGMRCK